MSNPSNTFDWVATVYRRPSSRTIVLPEDALDDRPGGCSPDLRAAHRRCYAEAMNDSKRSLRGRVGAPDRVQRLVIGLILMGLNVAGLMLHPEWVKWAALVVQVELVGTALIGWCPLYWSFGTHSCSMR